MDPRHLFVDERLSGACVYCGDEPETRDHVPSKVLLDEPFPPQLPVVEACTRCNKSFSLDEQYLACLIECVICGTVDTACLKRPKVKRILDENPALQQRIGNSRRREEADLFLQEPEPLSWWPEFDRVRKIVLKLAKGHAAYELYPKIEEPLEASFVPMQILNKEERDAFENLASGSVNPWPEIGSRAFHRASGKSPDGRKEWGDWIVVQPGRYRYAVAETGGILARMVLSDYLACEVLWED